MSSLQAVLVLIALVAVIALLAVLLIVFLRRDPSRPSRRVAAATTRQPTATTSVRTPGLAGSAESAGAPVSTAAGRPPTEGPTRASAAAPSGGASADPDAEQDSPATRSGVEADALLARATREAEEIRLAAGRLRDEAISDAESVRTRAETQSDRLRDEALRVRDEAANQRADIERRAVHLSQREERLDADRARVTQEQADLDDQRSAVGDLRAQAAQLVADRHAELERVAGLSAESARAELLASLESEAKLAAAGVVHDIEREAHAEADRRASGIITAAIQRLASEQTAESVVSVLHLPSDEMKGRIIGREGRNVRAFEQVTGVNLIIDDTPEAVLLSCFDPVRREVARVALERLVLDGRIHPQRIEEVCAASRDEVEDMCRRAGEDATLEMGITDLHPELVNTLGHLKYRTSYGQNVLLHLIESGHLAAMMAAELGLDVALCRRAAFLHDIGKALTHEVEGSHAIVGADLARRYGENEDVAHAIEAHHNEVEVRTVEAVLTQAADAISGGRPGARRESLEAYVKRLERLEEIASARSGVDRVFAMQAGREVRVMVLPDQVDDVAAAVIAREIAKQVEEELTYPGQIRVTVVRESRATEVAR
jgi:ribonuclease Y